jgi:hypothetical protein
MLAPRSVIAGLVVLSVLAINAVAEVPQLISYQGHLVDGEGYPLNATVDLTVTIFGSPEESDSLWAETYAGMSIEGGLFVLSLGSQTPFPSDLFDGSVRYLSIQMDDGPASTPRVAILSSAYSIRSGYADTAAIALSGAGGDAGWTDDGTTVRLTTATDRVGIGTTATDEMLHVENSAGSSGRAFLKLETSHATGFGECGMRFTTPDNTWHFRMDDNTHNNLPIAGSLSLRSQSAGKEVMILTADGDVGIGDATPDAKLDVNGDLEVSGAYRGNISSSSGSDGAPFPRPAYNSGWISVPAGGLDTLYHRVGGDPDNYVVDLQMRDTYRNTIHIRYHGMLETTYGNLTGWYYSELNDSSITVVRGASDHPDYVGRIRIWVIE